MFKVISFNLNGIRSAVKKGAWEWLAAQNADVICLQELKAQQEQISGPEFGLPGYHAYYHFAEKKGYSGVAIYTRHKPLQVVTGLGWPHADQEGRYVAVEFDGLWVASLYMPSGTSGDARQTVKFDFLEKFTDFLKGLDTRTKDYILCGDFNIAHKQIDLKNWRSNQKNSGFLPAERAWLDDVFGPLGFIDAFRVVNQEAEQYTWWSQRGRAREKNVGWRIDYQIVTPGLLANIKTAAIYKDQYFSDHAPLILEYDR